MYINNIVLAIDFTRSSNRTIRLDIIEKAIESIINTDVTLSLMYYGIRAYPIFEFARPDPEIIGMLSLIKDIDGPSEPYRPFRETLAYLIDYNLDPQRVFLVVHWSAPRKPKVPLVYGVGLAENLGLGWMMIVEKSSPPRWFWRWAKGVEDRNIIFYRKNINLYKLFASVIVGKAPR